MKSTTGVNIKWTADMDAVICRMRDARHSWAAIAARLDMTPSSVHDRGVSLGYAGTQDGGECEVAPLPPGSLWGLIVAGTVLDGSAYAHPSPILGMAA